MRLVLVEWVDSSRGDGWASIDSVDERVHAVRSVGWVVMDTPDALVIAPHHSEESGDADEQICGHMKIAKVAVRRVVTLKEPRARARR